MTTFGTGWGTPNGQDLSSPSYMASGNRIVAEAILRRWTTGRGELIDDPTYGYNVIDLISDDLTPARLHYAQQQLSAEAAKDERVRRAAVTLNLSVAGIATINAEVFTANGPFKFVAIISAVSTQLFLVSP